MLKTAFLSAVAAFGLSFSASAQDLGPAAGTRAPDIGLPLDQTETPRSLTSLMGDKGVVFFFFRSAVW
jgi:hypothetical protein